MKWMSLVYEIAGPSNTVGYAVQPIARNRLRLPVSGVFFNGLVAHMNMCSPSRALAPEIVATILLHTIALSMQVK